jgi:hypothetical protein
MKTIIWSVFPGTSSLVTSLNKKLKEWRYPKEEDQPVVKISVAPIYRCYPMKTMGFPPNGMVIS